MTTRRKIIWLALSSIGLITLTIFTRNPQPKLFHATVQAPPQPTYHPLRDDGREVKKLRLLAPHKDRCGSSMLEVNKECPIFMHVTPGEYCSYSTAEEGRKVTVANNKVRLCVMLPIVSLWNEKG